MTTRDDIARAVQEAGWSGLYMQWAKPTGQPDWSPFRESLTVPVTADQVERFFLAAFNAGVAAGRKACAQTCDEVGGRDGGNHAWDAAAAIRAGGTT